VRALEALTGLRLDPDSAPARAVATARRFIAFRTGQRGEEIDLATLPRPLSQPREGAQEIEQRAVPEEDLKREARALRAVVPELELAPDAALELTCKGGVQWLVPRAGLSDPAEIEDARKRPGVAFVLLARDRCVGGLFFDSYVLSQPEPGGGIGLYVTRLSGDIKLAGRAEPSDRGVRFSLGALNIRRNPGAISIGGQLDRTGRLTLSEALSASGRSEEQIAPLRPRAAEAAPI
jgi:hypothetical protein